MNTKPQVLVIDDDAVIGRSFDRVLSDKGYEVSTALSGEEALKDMENTDYDVVFTDIKMPGMNGIEASKRIKTHANLSKIPPIILVTAYAREEIMQQAEAAGLDGFLLKPVSPSVLFDTIMQAFGKDVSREIITGGKKELSALAMYIRALSISPVEVSIT